MSQKTSISRVALADQVMRVLQERILDRVYAPGARLNIDALTRELEVSSSPIREALTRLAADGLVVASAFTGFSVAPVPSRDWFEQLLTVRILAEGWAARQMARLRPAAAIERMRESLAAMAARMAWCSAIVGAMSCGTLANSRAWCRCGCRSRTLRARISLPDPSSIASWKAWSAWLAVR